MATEEGTNTRMEMFPFHAFSNEECYNYLDVGNNASHDHQGLTTEQAKERLEKYGYNKLSEKTKKTIWQRIWHQLANVLVGILVFVAAVSAAQVIRFATVEPNREDVITNSIQIALIAFVIIVNTIIGIYQEGSAEAAAEALASMLSSEAVVIRDGQDIIIPSTELVPGDIVRLSLGDRVPADLRMIEVTNLAAQEAALTGESVPVDKTVEPIVGYADPNSQPLGDRHNMCYSATLISSGSGTGLVVTTGDNTEIGTINSLVNKVEDKKTAMLQQIDEISKWLAIFVIIVAVITWLIAFFITEEEAMDALTTALVGAVAMIPEGLGAIVTMTYAWAVSNMAKQNAIVRALPAVETLGSVTVICSDKTGTLTKNEMTLVAFVTMGKRWKFFFEAKERTPMNFSANATYMATRADHTKFLKSNDVIKNGPSFDRKSRGGNYCFPFGITLGFGKTAHGGVEPEEPTHLVADEEEDDVTPTSIQEVSEHPDPSYLRRILAGGILCSKCVLGENGGKQGEIGNPTELSILRAAYFGDVNVSEVKDSAPVIAEVPFSSEYKFMSTVHEPVLENDGEDYMNELVVHVKGAPDRLLPWCKYQAKGGSFAKADLEPCDKNFWIEQIAVLSSHGLRVLALTRGSLAKGAVSHGDQLTAGFVQDREPWLAIVGLCAIMDPPRPECVHAIAEAHRAGVRVAMITGDHKETALAIGGVLGLVDKQHPDAITGPELDAMNDEELRLAVQKYNVFARASPQNKIKIVSALQAEREVCGMTGDGVVCCIHLIFEIHRVSKLRTSLTFRFNFRMMLRP
jgi:magnesium-transporting ATPase (P-type)